MRADAGRIELLDDGQGSTGKLQLLGAASRVDQLLEVRFEVTIGSRL